LPGGHCPGSVRQFISQHTLDFPATGTQTKSLLLERKTFGPLQAATLHSMAIETASEICDRQLHMQKAAGFCNEGKKL